jgi:hypothetical protein
VHRILPRRPIRRAEHLLRLCGRDVVEGSARDVVVDLLELQRWILCGGCFDHVHELRGGLLPAELGLRLLYFLPRGLVLCRIGSHGGDGRVLGGPVFSDSRDGLQRLHERVLPECHRAGCLRRVRER